MLNTLSAGSLRLLGCGLVFATFEAGVQDVLDEAAMRKVLWVVVVRRSNYYY